MFCEFTCPHCKETYPIENYNLGWGNAIEMRCDRCPMTLFVDFYIPPMDKLREIPEIEEALNPCRCGGSFKHSAPYRCLFCKQEVELKNIVDQIDWPGDLSTGAKPGITMGQSFRTGQMSNAWKVKD